MNMTHQKRAPKGGTEGVNGEFYEGGKFLPSTEKPKGKPRKRGSGKQEIEPYVWEVAPEGMRSIFRQIAGIYGRYDHNTKQFTFDCSPVTMACYRLDRARCEEMIARFNRGERWSTR